MADGPQSTPETASPPEGSGKAYYETRQVRPVDDIPLLTEAARSKGVAVNVLRNAGEDYYMMEYDPMRDMNINDRGPFKVPDGHSFVLISGTVDKNKGFGDFWDEVRRLEQERKQKQGEKPIILQHPQE